MGNLGSIRSTRPCYLEAALAHGIPREDVWIDCLALTVSAQQEQAAETLKAVRLVREELGLQTVLGVS